MKPIKVKSLQLELYLWIIACTIIIMLIGSIVAGAIAFFQARELQDNTLREISLLLRSGQLNPTATTNTLQSALERYNNHSTKNKKGFDDDTSIIFFEVKPDALLSNEEKFFAKKSDGLQTVDFFDEQWRTLIITQKQTDRKFIIAQPTELRDEIAVASALSNLYPIVVFVVCLLVLVHLVLRKQFSAIKQLTTSLDQQDGSHLTKLPAGKAPSEIQPFIQSINDLIERVQLTLAKQQRFIADAAHELRTPIAALSLQVENLNNAQNTDDRAERLSALQQGFLRLGNLVGQLLNLARLQANTETTDKKTMGMNTVSLNDVVKSVIQDLYPIAEKGKVDIGVIRQDENIMVKDSNGLLSQLVQNAIANAIHYTPENGEVNISIVKENQTAVLLVEDTGIGIPDDELEKVMQPFYRVLNSGKEGNGLGLTISREIADKLGGKIRLANRESGGLAYRYEQAIVSSVS